MSDLKKALQANVNGDSKAVKELMYKNKFEKLFVDVLSSEEHEERYGLHASAIIGPENSFCFREQLLSLFFKQNQGEQLPIKMLKIFAQGNAIHEKWYKMFRQCGIDVAIERTLFLPEYDLSFTIDALIDFNKPKGKKTDEIIVDVKSQNSFAFKKVKGHPSGEKQVNFYMWALSKYTGKKYRKGIVLVDSKDDQEIKTVVVEYDKEKNEQYISRLEAIQEMKKDFIENKKVPKRICNNPDCKRAIECNMRDCCFNIGIGRKRLKKNAI